MARDPEKEKPTTEDRSDFGPRVFRARGQINGLDDLIRYARQHQDDPDSPSYFADEEPKEEKEERERAEELQTAVLATILDDALDLGGDDEVAFVYDGHAVTKGELDWMITHEDAENGAAILAAQTGPAMTLTATPSQGGTIGFSVGGGPEQQISNKSFSDLAKPQDGQAQGANAPVGSVAWLTTLQDLTPTTLTVGGEKMTLSSTATFAGSVAGGHQAGNISITGTFADAAQPMAPQAQFTFNSGENVKFDNRTAEQKQQAQGPKQMQVIDLDARATFEDGFKPVLFIPTGPR